MEQSQAGGVEPQPVEQTPRRAAVLEWELVDFEAWACFHSGFVLAAAVVASNPSSETVRFVPAPYCILAESSAAVVGYP